ncbi:hypothetical protein K439DRAFT_1616373 [Ramaria rubella]|nr:hypothetical protein K439DRAFT_1616373 [Ramaria rubella]
MLLYSEDHALFHCPFLHMARSLLWKPEWLKCESPLRRPRKPSCYPRIPLLTVTGTPPLVAANPIPDVAAGIRPDGWTVTGGVVSTGSVGTDLRSRVTTSPRVRAAAGVQTFGDRSSPPVCCHAESTYPSTPTAPPVVVVEETTESVGVRGGTVGVEGTGVSFSGGTPSESDLHGVRERSTTSIYFCMEV